MMLPKSSFPIKSEIPAYGEEETPARIVLIREGFAQLLSPPRRLLCTSPLRRALLVLLNDAVYGQRLLIQPTLHHMLHEFFALQCPDSRQASAERGRLAFESSPSAPV